MAKLAKQAVWVWILIGVSSTVNFLDHLWNMEYYKSSVVLIPSVVGMILGYGIALAIVIARKIQNERFKKEQSKLES